MNNRQKYYRHKLYSLNCPLTGEVKYIGITKRYLNERLWRHLNPPKQDNSKKYEWIGQLKNQGLRPEIKLIRFIDDNENPEDVESKEIARYSNLVNSNRGGNKPPSVAGWNRIELPVEAIRLLGTMPDYKLAEIYNTNKHKIQEERNSRGIPSYASTTGSDGRFNGKGVHPRWKK